MKNIQPITQPPSRVFDSRTEAGGDPILAQSGSDIQPRTDQCNARGHGRGRCARCGFTHVASLAIFVGGIGALAPSRYKDLSRLAFRALVAATLVGLMTGAVAGTFFTGSSILLGK